MSPWAAVLTVWSVDFLLEMGPSQMDIGDLRHVLPISNLAL